MVGKHLIQLFIKELENWKWLWWWTVSRNVPSFRKSLQPISSALKTKVQDLWKSISLSHYAERNPGGYRHHSHQQDDGNPQTRRVFASSLHWKPI